jgi:dephospho-CoA kinase
MMLTIILTGGLGAGKSTAARYLASRGAVVIDLDEISRSVLAPGTPAEEAVIAEFAADGVTSPDGALDREALARAAFATPQSVRRLNAIVHPAVTEALSAVMEEIGDSPDPPEVVAVEVPLLTEAPWLAAVVDSVLAIEAPVEARIARAGRRGIEEDDARRRIALQAEDSHRAALAEEVIVNDGTEREFVAKLSEYWDRLRARIGDG